MTILGQFSAVFPQKLIRYCILWHLILATICSGLSVVIPRANTVSKEKRKGV